MRAGDLREGGWSCRVLLLVLAVALGGCASVTRQPLPSHPPVAAHPLGLPGLRIWGDVLAPHEVDATVERQAALMRGRFGADLAAGRVPTLDLLAISGGGQDGAFTAGILRAWTESGTRPEFQGVSGISTGAIIAPFAFLGPAYDHVIEEIYTTLRTDQVASRTVVSGLLYGVALADTSGLAAKIAQYVTAEFLARIAAEYRRGRVLLVGTTNLDAGRPMIWNMGAIADSGHPGALQLFRDVIRASAAIPVAFPPVLIQVRTPDGRIYDELHVDGGATSQVVLISPQVPIAALTRRYLGRNINRRLWVIVNNRLMVPAEPVRPRIFSIAGASISSLIRASGIGDVYKLYLIAERDEMAFHTTWIPTDLPCEPNEDFDPAYMRCLFDVGREHQRRGDLWSSLPPHFVRPPAVPAPELPAAPRRGRPAS